MTGNIDKFIKNIKTNNLRCSEDCLYLMAEAKRLGVSPCKICTLNSDPTICTNIRCVPWAHWFFAKWKEIRKASGVEK